jgi:hypothetical protein
MNIDLILKREKERVQKITVATYHRQERDKWLRTKRILDWINKQLSVLDDGPQELNLNPDSLFDDQKALLAPTLKNLFQSGIATFGGHIGTAVITGEPARQFSEGESVVIKDRQAFEDYHQKISEFSDFIEKDGQVRFPQEYHASRPIPVLSNSDRKKLFILEKLKDEKDLMPKEMRKVDIHPPKFSRWMRECGIDDYTQLRNILASLEEEGLLISVKSINPAM